MLRTEIETIFNSALNTLDIKDENVTLTHPTDLSHGDYATNIALRLANKLKMSPLELAEKIAKAVPKSELIDRVEVLKPGFINIHLSPTQLIAELKRSSTKEFDLGKQFKAKNNHILLEFGQPNTHKTPHIGHLFSYTFGESLARLTETVGNKVTRINYQGDIGLHVAKCLYGFNGSDCEKYQNESGEELVNILQKCYQLGATAYEEDTEAKKKIDQINNELYLGKDIELDKFWKATRKWSLDFYKNFETVLGIKYDKYYFETETATKGKNIITAAVEKYGGDFVLSDGATIFKGENYGLHTRVFLTSKGNPTYEAKDIGLIKLKAEDFTDFTESIVLTAVEQNEYWKVVLKATAVLFPDIASRSKHIGFGMINLPSGKMSSRTGQIINAFSLISTIEDEIRKQYNMNDEEVVKKIALAAIKYSFLKSDPQHNKTFDIETSVAKEGNSGPYLLYTFVRASSILRDQTLNDVEIGEKLELEESQLLRLLVKFPEVVEQAAQRYSPSDIATYLYSIAQAFNLFYQKHPVLKSEGQSRAFRLQLTASTANILQSGLNLLGIQTVEKM